MRREEERENAFEKQEAGDQQTSGSQTPTIDRRLVFVCSLCSSLVWLYPVS